MAEFLKKHAFWIAAAILLFHGTVSILNAKNDSTTFDEVAHIPAGYSYLVEHDTRLNPEHPPLIKDLSAFPLLFLGLNFDTTQKFWTGELKGKWDEGQWAAGRHLLYEAGNDADRIVFWARVPIVLLSLALGLFLFRWGKELVGTLGGLLVLFLYAFDPNILGHNHFVTTDIGVAAFLTFAFYYFLRFLKKPTWKNTVLGGIFLGLLLVSKFSSIVALPIFGFSLLAYSFSCRTKHPSWKERFLAVGNYFGKALAAFAVAAIVIWGVYKANTFAMPKEVFAQTVNFFFSPTDSNIKTVYTNKALHALNESDLTRPWATYLFGPAWMFKRVSGGNGAYFLGEVGNGFTWYFPTVFAIKETIPFLALTFFALFYGLARFIRNAARTDHPKGLRHRLAHFLRESVIDYTLLAFIAAYAYLSITGGLNIGFRHLFPILPFIYLLIGKKVFELYRRAQYHTKQLILIFLGFLLSWLLLTTLAAYPYYMSYFNEAVGGPKQGYHLVTDSNADWGQDLKRLRDYLDRNPLIDKIRVDYFGGGNPRLYLEDKYLQWWDSKRPIEAGWYAISVNFLQGSIYDTKRPDSDTYRWLQNYEPVDRVGTSILIYHITEPPRN